MTVKFLPSKSRVISAPGMIVMPYFAAVSCASFTGKFRSDRIPCSSAGLAMML